MEMMMLGEDVVFANNTRYEGFWMPAGGDEVTGAIDVAWLLGASNFTIDLETKNSEDIDSSAVSIVTTPPTVSGTGVTKVDGSGAKELVRYVLTGSGDCRVHFQLLQPQWVPN